MPKSRKVNDKVQWYLTCEYHLANRLKGYDDFLNKKARQYNGMESGGGCGSHLYDQSFIFKNESDAKRFASYLKRLKTVVQVGKPYALILVDSIADL